MLYQITQRVPVRTGETRTTGVERCDLCALELAGGHQHLLELPARQLLCACEACAILFDGQKGARYKRVPRRILFLREFSLTPEDWETLNVPVGMAFFCKTGPSGDPLGVYPSPAGPIQSALPLETWSSLTRLNPILDEMQPDVEALLVNRARGGPGGAGSLSAAPEYYLAPIDECYGLVGIMRRRWSGFTGGTQVWEDIQTFFAGLKEKSAVA